MLTFSMPTKIIFGLSCIKEHSKEFTALGKKALIVTGKTSSKCNGSRSDVREALEKHGISYVLFEEVTSNPFVDVAREAAEIAREEKIEFVIGVGGGSPLDVAKAVAVLAKNDLDDRDLFSGPYPNPFLAVVAIPTTAGTGSEVTQYSVLSNKYLETKTSIAHPGIFPKISFLDARYTMSLPRHITINTALDALSHAVEGYLSATATNFSNIFAEKSLRILGECLPHLTKEPTLAMREKLMYASMLAGVVIAHTRTTVVHSIGYSLTYFKNIDHGRANAMLLTGYLQFLDESYHYKIQELLEMLCLKSIEEFALLIDKLLGDKEEITFSEAKLFSAKAAQSANINTTLMKPTEQDLLAMLQKSLLLKA